jgi:hypothetical protein
MNGTRFEGGVRPWQTGALARRQVSRSSPALTWEPGCPLAGGTKIPSWDGCRNRWVYCACREARRDLGRSSYSAITRTSLTGFSLRRPSAEYPEVAWIISARVRHARGQEARDR